MIHRAHYRWPNTVAFTPGGIDGFVGARILASPQVGPHLTYTKIQRGAADGLRTSVKQLDEVNVEIAATASVSSAPRHKTWH